MRHPGAARPVAPDGADKAQDPSPDPVNNEALLERERAAGRALSSELFATKRALEEARASAAMESAFYHLSISALFRAEGRAKKAERERDEAREVAAHAGLTRDLTTHVSFLRQGRFDGAWSAMADDMEEAVQAITTLLSRLEVAEAALQSTQAELTRVREALTFYRDEWRWYPVGDEGDGVTDPGCLTGYEAEPTQALADDGGAKARAALAAQPQEEGR